MRFTSTISRRTSRTVTIAMAVGLILAGCGGSDSDEAADDGDNGIVISQEQLDAAQAERDETEPEPEALSSDEAGVDTGGEDTNGEPEEDDPADNEIAVAEAGEDELDGFFNAISVFNACIDDEGYEFIGAPGQDGATAEDFESDYLAVLGACATESEILSAFQSFGEAQANLSPAEIAQNNFGLPTFKECVEDLGWTVEDLVPDERGALGFGATGIGLQPPEGAEGLNFDDANTCRTTAEQYVADNYVADEAG